MKKRTFPTPRSRGGLIFKIVCVYYATVLGFIACVAYAGLPERAGGLPADWQVVLAGLYYAAPLLIAFVFGILFRPFWKNFRDLLASIVLVHFLYSAALLGWRQVHLNHRQDVISESFLAVVKAEAFSHRLMDNDQDGLIDEAVVWGRLDIEDLPPGRYVNGIVLSQDGKDISGVVDRRGFRKKAEKKADVRFRFDPREYGSFERPVTVDLHIFRLIEVDKEDERIMRFSQWMPFFQQTSWRGQDRDFYPDMVRIEILYGVDSVELLPL